MPNKTKSIQELEQLCKQFRIDLIAMLYHAQTGHPGGSLSACELLTTLYYHHMNIRPHEPTWADRDRFVLSKGHGVPMLYLILAQLQFFPKEELFGLRHIDQMLQGQPSASKVPGVDMTTGSLGLGLSAACGIAAAARVQKKNFYTYAMVGDGELQEGVIWEAVQTIAKYNLSNLITLIDYNKVQLDGTTDEVMPLGDLAEKFRAFGLRTLEIDGHQCGEISDAVTDAKANTHQPTVIIANTIKGKGVSFMEGDYRWHGATLTSADYSNALLELGGRVYAHKRMY